MAVKSRQSGLRENAVTIKHGSAPEIQAVNISIKKRRSDASKLKGFENGDSIQERRASELEETFYRKRPVSKTMTTTKSTMTNDEDYQIEITKSPEGGVEDESGDSSGGEEEVELRALEHDAAEAAVKESQQKILAWKMTPKVHFPSRRDSTPCSAVPSGARHPFHGSLATTSQTMDWQYLPNPIIEPPFEHRPDKTYVIHQNQPIPLNPLKVWPGYGGNLYFEPMRVQSKPISIRDASERRTVSRVRSRATSRYTFGDHSATTPEALSDLKLASLPPSSPYHGARNLNYSPVLSTLRKSFLATPPYIDNHVLMKPQDFQSGLQAGDLLFQRQMAHLDKNYVLSMKGNPKLHEDWSWIAGMESIGTLRIGDTGGRTLKQGAKPYTRSLVVEKVPRNFVFHPGNKRVGIDDASAEPKVVPLVQVKIDNTKWTKFPARDYAYWKKQSISNWTTHKKRQLVSNESKDKSPDQKRSLRLPSIPFKVKGNRVPETHFYNPWDISHGSPKPAPSSRATSKTNHSGKARQLMLHSKVAQASFDDKENQPLSITNWPSRNESVKAKESGGKIFASPDVNSDFFTSNRRYEDNVDHETDDEDKLNYDTIKSAIYSRRNDEHSQNVQRAPNTTPC